MHIYREKEREKVVDELHAYEEDICARIARTLAGHPRPQRERARDI